MKTPVKIRVAIATRTALRQLGQKGDTYDAVIRRLIKYWIQDIDPREASPIGALLDIEEEVRER